MIKTEYTETARAMDTLVMEKINRGIVMTIDTQMDTLVDLICSRRSIKSQGKNLFTKYNLLGLIGKEGAKVDTYFAQLGRDISNSMLETFCWVDYTKVVTIIEIVRRAHTKN